MRNIVVSCTASLFLVVIGFTIYYEFFSIKIVHVDSIKLYNGFSGKKELEKQYEAQKQRQQTYLDSMFLDLQVMEKELAEDKVMDVTISEKYATKRKVFEELKYNFEKNNKDLEAKYWDAIWKNLNQYVLDYGKEKGYDYILGATGTGDLMYGVTKRDITNEMIEYANKKYLGK